MIAIERIVEAKFVGLLNGALAGTGVRAYGVYAPPPPGQLPEQPLTSLAVKAAPRSNNSNNYPAGSVDVQLVLYVAREAADAPTRWAAAFDAVAAVLEALSPADQDLSCLSGGRWSADDLHCAGGSVDYDQSLKAWYCVWSVTVTGHITDAEADDA